MTAQGLITDGPFVVRHLKLPAHDGDTGYEIAVKAVADLFDFTRDDWRWTVDQLRQAAESGEPIRELDGSEIHVEATTVGDLVRDSGLIGSVRRGMTRAEIVVAWNSRFGVAVQEKGGERDD